MMVRKLFRGQEGLSMLMVLVFMALAVPMVTAALSLSGGLSTDSRVKTDILKRQYSGLGGSEFAQHLVESGEDPGDYTVDLNDETVDVMIADPPLPAQPPPPADDSRRLQTDKSVSPDTAASGSDETFTYTIKVTNRDDDPENVEKINDTLPDDLTYEVGSTSGVISDDPGVAGQTLTWNLAPYSIVLDPGDSIQLEFRADGEDLPEGNYCNEAWAEPGDEKTGTGLTALIQVGSPPTDLCDGAAADIGKTVEVEDGTFLGGESLTYTYTITIENTGTAGLDLQQVRDLLPEGFTYVSGTVSGNLTTSEPNDQMWDGRNRLTWTTFTHGDVIPAGETRTLTFDAEGVFDGGHWNEVWVTFDQFSESLYSWPTAAVQVDSIAETTSTTEDGTTVTSQIWKLGDDTYLTWEWEIES